MQNTDKAAFQPLGYQFHGSYRISLQYLNGNYIYRKETSFHGSVTVNTSRRALQTFWQPLWFRK